MEKIREQLGSGYNCESDPTTPSGFACVQNQFGAGQFPNLQSCLSDGCETVQGGCCDDCANFPANFVPDSNYHSIGRFCTGCAVAAGTNIVITNPSNPTQTFYGLTSNISVHSVGTTANADGQDYCCDCCNQGHLPWPVSSIPSAAMNGCGDVVNGTTPKTQDPKNPLGVDKDFKGPKEKMPVGNNYDKKKITKKDVESIKEETNRFKQLISEQLGSGYNCETDLSSPSGTACVQNQFGAGQFPDLPTCLASGCEDDPIVEVPTCAQNGFGYECFYCPGPGKVQTQSYQIGEKYTPTKKTVACVMIGSNNPNLLTNGTNLYNTKDECNTAESECMNPPGFVATKCHCCRKEQYIDVVYDQYPHVMIGQHKDCSFIERNGGQVNPNNILQTYQWEHCAPVSQPIPCSAKTPWVDDNNTLGYKTKPKEDMGRGVREETNRFKQLISEQLGSGWNCEVDASSPSGFLCIQNQFGAGQYVSQAACQAAGCESNGVCPAGHPWHGWPSGYPTNNDFVWNGPPINMNFGGSVLNFPTGSIVGASYANWFNAGQSSYCEWCADYNSGGGSSTNSQGFDLRTNYWVGGGYGPEACSCCPANNGMGQPLPRMAPIYKCSNGCEPTDEEEDTRGETYKSREECMKGCGIGEKETTQSVCCSWCETQKGGRPPKGCYDFDCDDCITKPVRLREDIENIRLLHKKHSKIKGNG